MDPQIKEMIEAELIDFGTQFKEDRKAFLARQISASGDLEASINYKLDEQARADTAAIMLTFNDYGRFIDMKRLKAVVPSDKNSEYIEALKKWIEEKGLTAKLVNGVMEKYKLKMITPDLLGRIAFGIAINRAKKVRPRKWYNKRKSAGITDVFNKVVAKLPYETTDIIHKQFR